MPTHLLKIQFENSKYVFIREAIIFGLKQARACVFAGSFFALLFVSTVIPLGPLPRYDFIFLGAVVIQAVLIWTKLETTDEAKTIALFHVVGFVLEVFKTRPEIGSWTYPEFGYLKIFSVPLYSGFMYAAVGSYISQAWKLFHLRLTGSPGQAITVPLAAAIYLNFFTHHYVYDFRWLLALLVLVVFYRTKVYFTVTKKEFSMPLPLSFVLIGFFIWIAENVATFFGAWQYPDQAVTWTLVHPGKVSSWSLLVIISFIIVANLKEYKMKYRQLVT
ncbi:MAG: DUF817 domain-containing protein [Patescibacteria group bacterium]